MFARVLLGTTSTVRALTSFVEALLLIYYKGVFRHSYIYKHIEDHRMLVLQTAPTCIMINHVCFGQHSNYHGLLFVKYTSFQQRKVISIKL